jgi:hypothetical protein
MQDSLSEVRRGWASPRMLAVAIAARDPIGAVQLNGLLPQCFQKAWNKQLRTMNTFAAALLHLPFATACLDETILLLGSVGVLKDLRMVGRINTMQAAWPHAPHFSESIAYTHNAKHDTNGTYNKTLPCSHRKPPCVGWLLIQKTPIALLI